MQSHDQLNDVEFIHQIEKGILDSKLFSHEAHLRLAWIHIRQDGIDTAIETICKQLLNYVSKLGAKDKFHKTLTIAATRGVYHFMLQSNYDNFKDFIDAFPQLKYNFKSLLRTHYHIDIFNLDIAKHTFIEPDALPFD